VHPDPDEAWDRVGPLLLHESNLYARWLREGRGGAGPYVEAADVDQLRREGRYGIVTPDECVELVRRHGSLDLEPLAGGLPAELSQASRKLIEHEVLPAVAG
jgi:hypothetical protein